MGLPISKKKNRIGNENGNLKRRRGVKMGEEERKRRIKKKGKGRLGTFRVLFGCPHWTLAEN